MILPFQPSLSTEKQRSFASLRAPPWDTWTRRCRTSKCRGKTLPNKNLEIQYDEKTCAASRFQTLDPRETSNSKVQGAELLALLTAALLLTHSYFSRQCFSVWGFSKMVDLVWYFWRVCLFHWGDSQSYIFGRPLRFCVLATSTDAGYWPSLQPKLRTSLMNSAFSQDGLGAKFATRFASLRRQMIVQTSPICPLECLEKDDHHIQPQTKNTENTLVTFTNQTYKRSTADNHLFQW